MLGDQRKLRSKIKITQQRNERAFRKVCADYQALLTLK